jgi:hypothetical protein
MEQLWTFLDIFCIEIQTFLVKLKYCCPLASFSVFFPAMAQIALIMWFSSIYKSHQAFYFMHIVFEIFTLFMNACMFFLRNWKRNFKSTCIISEDILRLKVLNKAQLRPIF